MSLTCKHSAVGAGDHPECHGCRCYIAAQHIQGLMGACMHEDQNEMHAEKCIKCRDELAIQGVMIQLGIAGWADPLAQHEHLTRVAERIMEMANDALHGERQIFNPTYRGPAVKTPEQAAQSVGKAIAEKALTGNERVAAYLRRLAGEG